MGFYYENEVSFSHSSAIINYIKIRLLIIDVMLLNQFPKLWINDHYRKSLLSSSTMYAHNSILTPPVMQLYKCIQISKYFKRIQIIEQKLKLYNQWLVNRVEIKLIFLFGCCCTWEFILLKVVNPALSLHF